MKKLRKRSTARIRRRARRRLSRSELDREIARRLRKPLISRRVARIGLVLALMAMGGLFYHALTQKVTEIEQDLHDRVQAVLEARSLNDITVKMNGRTAILTGTLTSEADRTAAMAAVAETYGVRNVVDELIIDTPITALTEKAPTSSDGTTETSSPVFPDAIAQEMATTASRLKKTSGTVPQTDEATSSNDTPPSTPATTGPAPARSTETAGAVTANTGEARNTGAHEDASPDETATKQAQNTDTGTQTGTSSPSVQTASTADRPDRKVDPEAIKAAQRCAAEFKKLLGQEQIRFRHNSTRIRRESLPLLKKLAEIARSCPNSHLIIIGHTDNRGSAAYNQKLSERRARAVRDWLIREGIDADRIEAIGKGESEPIASNRTLEGRKKNRRIEIKVVEVLS